MPDAEITSEQAALARRAAWIMLDLHGLEQAIETVDETIDYYTRRQAAGFRTDEIWVLDKLRAALVEIQAERGTAVGMLVTTHTKAGAHESLNAAEEYDRAAGTLTPDAKNRYRAQRYWVDRIADARVHTEHPPTWPGYIDNR